jgi:hypothetical protein
LLRGIAANSTVNGVTAITLTAHGESVGFIALYKYYHSRHRHFANKEEHQMNFYSLGKAIYLTARFEIMGSKDRRSFASFQTAKFFNLMHPV